ncbi:MAG: L,D-transpeptidase [Pseudomonadota bacterium]
MSALACVGITTTAFAQSDIHPDPELLKAMGLLLAGDQAAALTAAQAAADPLGLKLVTELTDLARGGYATRGNRAFRELAPLWAMARAAHVAAQPVPANVWPDRILALSESTPSVLIVDSTRNIAWLYERRDTEIWRVTDGFYVTIGRAGAGKQRRGDRKTPLGVFQITGEEDTRGLPARYGARVLPLDYPTALDRHLRRTGDGIWLHGIDPANNIRPPQDTDGCVAFANARIEQLAEQLVADRSLVLVAEEVRWQPSVLRSPLLQDLRAHMQDYLQRADLPALVPGMDIVLADATTGTWLVRVHPTGERARPVRFYWQRARGEWRLVTSE